eukprot:9482217-Pyramimonas_sp.AAC.2
MRPPSHVSSLRRAHRNMHAALEAPPTPSRARHMVESGSHHKGNVRGDAFMSTAGSAKAIPPQPALMRMTRPRAPAARDGHPPRARANCERRTRSHATPLRTGRTRNLCRCEWAPLTTDLDVNPPPTQPLSA